MKKNLDGKTLVQEAAFWDGMKKVAAEHPGKACQK